MPTQALYDKTVKNAQAGDGSRTVYWDSAISNDTSLSGSFGLRVTGNGVKSWIIMYRIEDPRKPGKKKQQFRKIGSYPALSLSEARDAARDALEMVGRSVDPIEAREAELRENADVITVAKAVNTFIEGHAKEKNRSWHEVEAITRKAVEKAIEGDMTAIRLCMERLIPVRKDRTVSFSLPEINGADDGAKAMAC